MQHENYLPGDEVALKDGRKISIRTPQSLRNSHTNSQPSFLTPMRGPRTCHAAVIKWLNRRSKRV
jgi:hypothetical protein